MPHPPERIRNFSIIAHIDHGKSTLADRIIEFTGALSDREKTNQFLDNMDLERERGITIKAQTVRLDYTADDGKDYVFNLIDTPGHVDFGYEVSRSLAACEGALLVVDASQGVEAQTLANVYLALDNHLEIQPVLNKIDLASAEPERVRSEIEEVIGIDASGAILASAKTGLGTKEILEAVVKHLPPPKGDPAAPLKALIFDSWYDTSRGVVVLVRIKDGSVRKGMKIHLMATNKDYEVTGVGTFSPKAREVAELTVGEVGFLHAAIKDVADTRIGDTLTETERPTPEALPGFKLVKPMVFSGIFPVESADHEPLRDALEKLQLNDSAFTYEPETSDALGFGFRCGYLGLLHMEIVQERLEREYNLNLINTSPSVMYRVQTTKGETIELHSPSKLPQVWNAIEEPIAKVTLHLPEAYVGAVLKLCQDRRGVQVGFEYSAPGRVVLTYEIPYAEVVYDFFDKLKSCSRGYASMDYEIIRWQDSDLVKLDILVNGELVDALSTIVHRDASYLKGQGLARKLKDFIPRQMWDVAIQAAIGSRVIARTTVKAMRKDVTAKCYGGDISRKRKLLEKQKEGKKRMKSVGSVEIPQEAFMAVLSMDDDE